MELLVPVGSKDALKAAIAGGADAVYLGGKLFGARRLAENFTDAELGTAVRLAHSHGMRVYLTVNTLIKESELRDAFSYLDYLESIGVDAVIVQDRGLLRLIRDNFSLPVHASTQMGIHSPEGAVWAEENGISRVILARELRLDELRKIREAARIELEVFIHGALCYSFSGQCLFSSFLGGRSGNRGLCTQPCRKKYAFGGGEGYMLSTADLFGVEAIPDLLKAGVAGLKVEGRMRSPLYVYLTSKIYSAAIRRAERCEEPLIAPREREMLEVVFNRGFSRGYLYGDDVMQRAYAGSRGLPIGAAEFDGEKAVVESVPLGVGDGVTLYRGDEKVGGFEVLGDGCEGDKLVLRPPFRVPAGTYRLYKTKDREFDAFQREIDSIDFHSEQLTWSSKRQFPAKTGKHRGAARVELSFYVSSLKTLERVMPYADRIYFDWNSQFDEASKLCGEAGVECVLVLPRLSFGVPDTDYQSLMVNSVDQLEKYSARKLYGGSSMNIFNSYASPRLFQSTLSIELSRDDIAEVAANYSGRLEVVAFGRMELMVSREASLGGGVLMDEKGVKFPVYRDRFGFTHVMNSSDLLLLDYVDELEAMGVNSLGIDVRGRDAALCETVAKAFHNRDLNLKAVIKKKCKHITASHYQRGVN